MVEGEIEMKSYYVPLFFVVISSYVPYANENFTKPRIYCLFHGVIFV